MLDQSRDLRVYIGHCWFLGRCALWRSGSWQRGWTARSYQATNRWSRAGSTSRVNYWTCIWRWGDVFRKLSGSYQASKVLEIQPWFWGTTRSRNSRFVAVGFTCVWQVFFSQNLTTPCSASCQTVDSLNSKTTISAMTEHEQKPSTVHRGPWSLCLLYIYIHIYVIADSLQLETSCNLGIWKNKGLYWLQPIQVPVTILIILYLSIFVIVLSDVVPSIYSIYIYLCPYPFRGFICVYCLIIYLLFMTNSPQTYELDITVLDPQLKR